MKTCPRTVQQNEQTWFTGLRGDGKKGTQDTGLINNESGFGADVSLSADSRTTSVRSPLTGNSHCNLMPESATRLLTSMLASHRRHAGPSHQALALRSPPQGLRHRDCLHTSSCRIGEKSISFLSSLLINNHANSSASSYFRLWLVTRCRIRRSTCRHKQWKLYPVRHEKKGERDEVIRICSCLVITGIHSTTSYSKRSRVPLFRFLEWEAVQHEYY